MYQAQNALAMRVKSVEEKVEGKAGGAIKGAVRATPRTWLIQPQANQPKKAETNTDHSKPNQSQGPSNDQGTSRANGRVTSNKGKPPSKVA